MSAIDGGEAPVAGEHSDEVKNARRKRSRRGKGKRKSDDQMTEASTSEGAQDSQAMSQGSGPHKDASRGSHRGRHQRSQRGHQQDRGQRRGQTDGHQGNQVHGGNRGGRGMRYSQFRGRGSPHGSPTRTDNDWGQRGHPGRSSPLNIQGHPNNHYRGQPPGSPHSPGQYAHSPGQYPHSPGPYPQSPNAYPNPYSNSPGMYAGNPYQNPMAGQNPFFQGQSPGQGHAYRGQQNYRGNHNSPGNRQKPQKNHQNQRKKLFEAHWTMEEVSHGLKRGEIIQGPLRINPRNYEDCYVPHPDGVSDVYICGTKDRNRALNSDIVVVQLYPREEWKVLLDDLETQEHRPATNKSQSTSGKPDSASPDDASQVRDEAALTTTDGTKTTQPVPEIADSNDKTPATSTDSDIAQKVPAANSDAVPPTEIATLDSSVQPGSTPSAISTISAQCAQLKLEFSESDQMDVTEQETSTADQSVETLSRTDQLDETLSKVDTPSRSTTQTYPADPVGDSAKLKTSRTNTPHSERLLQKAHGKHNRRSNTPHNNETPRNETPVGQNGSSVKKQGQKFGQATPRKRYTTLRDYASTPDINRVTKKLFMNDKGASEEKDGKAEKEGKEELDQEQVKQRMDAVPIKALVRTGKIVAIIEKKNSRAGTGHLRLMTDKNTHTALFVPIDHRLPRLMVPMEDCPKDFHERPEDHSKVLFVVQLTEWEEHSQYARGRLKRSLGEAGEIEPETEGILMSYDVDYAEFSDETLACLPQNLPWTIPPSEFEYRKDLRKECVFTIDPATARDLDDALHVKNLGDGIFEVGVHIADVSFFLEDDTALDEVASQRSTSVYLVQKVVPMLPRLLCEQLCSLNPDADRLTFSVIWKMTEQGEILDEWFGRSVIRSCVKMAYDHAQGFIEEPDREWTEAELPPISGGFSVETIKEKVLYLQRIARNMRKKRFDGGALRLDQVKLSFTLDKDSGMPNGYYVYQQRDSNKLIEEFMLLANMAVSHKIYKSFPDQAVLRRHPPPQTKMMDDLVKTCRALGVPIDISSSKSIHESIIAMSGETLEDLARVQILTVLCSKPMQNAKYFCTGMLEDEYEYRHYALNVPLYTHFTSPIRRYPDVMVHRLLAAALGYRPPVALEKTTIQQRADHSNDKKTNSKRVQELSSEIFFAVFIKECGPLEERAMVMGVLDKSFDVLVLKLGVVKRVYCEKLPLRDYGAQRKHGRPELRLIWQATDDHPETVTQDISIFSLVDCVLSADPEPLKWTAIIKHPNHAAVE